MACAGLIAVSMLSMTSCKKEVTVVNHQISGGGTLKEYSDKTFTVLDCHDFTGSGKWESVGAGYKIYTMPNKGKAIGHYENGVFILEVTIYN